VTIQGPDVAVGLACGRANCSGEAELSGSTGARTTDSQGTSAQRERVALAVGRYELTEGSTATVLVPLTGRGPGVIAGASTHLLPETLAVTVRGGKRVTEAVWVLSASSAARSLVAGTRFFVPAPLGGAVRQDAGLKSQGDLRDAALVGRMLATSHAVWFGGETPQGGTQTPQEVQAQVSGIMREAASRGSVPVLATFNIPGRDCEPAGAVDEAAYENWIGAFARGIGGGKAVVILEPDSLANLPSDCLNSDSSLDATRYPFSDAGRLAEINYSVAAIEKDPHASVYLDGGNSAWQPVGTIAAALVRAGVENAQGFVLNVSSNQYTANSIAYGTWVSDCIAYGVFVKPGNFSGCPNQYWNGGPGGTEIAKLLRAWHGVALNSYGVWSGSTTTADLNISGIDARYESLLGSTKPFTHFVIDTSLNGRGMNDMAAYASAPYHQPASVISALVGGNLCNPPGSGLGLAPTTDTGEALVDAYLWVRNPGESGGQCDSAGSTRAWDFSAYSRPGWPTSVEARSLFDPLWGRIDPAPGSWFPELALQLVNDAVQSRKAPENE
jgi:endoglucanase